jgi:hypothetical protein
MNVLGELELHTQTERLEQRVVVAEAELVLDEQRWKGQILGRRLSFDG